MQAAVENLARGDFVRVAKDADFRPGQDGMVVSPPDASGDLGLIFCFDRYNERIAVPSESIELWNVAELDLGSVERD